MFSGIRRAVGGKLQLTANLVPEEFVWAGDKLVRFFTTQSFPAYLICRCTSARRSSTACRAGWTVCSTFTPVRWVTNADSRLKVASTV